ncbi:hypothetical protein ABW19_dt0209097 [Dactylella cylindrospora]|nr:hypothetical protein ABW19_dt0209097 [Dactylella cylindrospora]
MSAPITVTSMPSTPSTSRSPSPSSPSAQKARTQAPTLPALPPTSDPFSTPTSNPSWRRSHIRSKSSSSVSPPPSMIRANSLPLPNRGITTKTQGPPPSSPKWTTTPASPTYRNSFVPTFPSPAIANLPSLNKRPAFLRTATPPPPPRTPPSYLATEVFPGAIPPNSQTSSYPPSLTSGTSSPTSSRSCSPSLTTYSLETIEDSPDGELLAVLEEEEEKQQREQAEKEDKEGDAVGLGLSLVTSSMNNMSLRENKKRQRWSVCGAERRSDFDLETIYED